MFGSGSGPQREASLRQRLQRRKSVLDFVMEDVKTMDKSLGRNDRQKVDDYLAGVRHESSSKSRRPSAFHLPNPSMDTTRWNPREPSTACGFDA